MKQLPLKNDRIGVIFQGQDPKHNLAFTGAVGLNLATKKTEFISATGAISQKDLGIRYNSGIEPRELRKSIIDCKVDMINRGKNIHVKETNTLFQSFFGKYSSRFCQLLTENNIKAAKDYCRDIMSNKLMDSHILEVDIYFVEFEALEMKDENIPQVIKKTPKKTRPRNAQNNSSSGNTIPISPVIGLNNGVKVGDINKGDMILVRPAGKAAQKFTDANNNSGKVPTMAASFAGYERGGKGNGILRVHLQENIYGQCTVSPGSLLKKASCSNRNNNDSVQKNITVFIWLIVSCIIIFGFSWLLISVLGA